VQASTNSGLHCDGKDNVNTFDAVAPFGSFCCSNLLLWGLKLQVQLKRGDVFLFYGSILYQNIMDVTGKRNSVNLFCHWTTMLWAKQVMKGKEEPGTRAKKVCHGLDWKKVDKEGK
jgi:hypothetical protein